MRWWNVSAITIQLTHKRELESCCCGYDVEGKSGNPAVCCSIFSMVQYGRVQWWPHCFHVEGNAAMVATWKKNAPWPRGRKIVATRAQCHGHTTSPEGNREHRPPRRTEHPADAFMLSEIGDINEYRCRSKVRRNRSLASFSIIQNRKPRTRCSSICLIVVCVTSVPPIRSVKEEIGDIIHIYDVRIIAK